VQSYNFLCFGERESKVKVEVKVEVKIKIIA